MSVNRHLPHIVVLPEDDANRQLVNGFLLDPFLAIHKIRVLPEAGGWTNVLSDFVSEHVANMDAYSQESMILLIDFDGQEQRLAYAKTKIPERLADRVFVLGVLTQPEALRRDLGRHYEQIGCDMAQGCRENEGGIWQHALLQHNEGELVRLREHVCPVLFPAPG